MKEVDDIPDWFGSCIWHYSDWSSKNNKSVSDRKWGICPSKDNHSDAAYNFEAADVRVDFELGLSRINRYNYEEDLRLLRDILLKIDKKIDDPANKHIRGGLKELRTRFCRDYREAIAAFDLNERVESPEETEQEESRPVRR